MNDRKQYRVLIGRVVTTEGPVKAGGSVLLTEKDGQRLVQRGIVELVPVAADNQQSNPGAPGDDSDNGSANNLAPSVPGAPAAPVSGEAGQPTEASSTTTQSGPVVTGDQSDNDVTTNAIAPAAPAPAAPAVVTSVENGQPTDASSTTTQSGPAVTADQSGTDLTSNAIAPAAPAPAAPVDLNPEQRIAAIVGAINQLDPADQSQWLKSGAPDLNALEPMVGFTIRAAERDAAWQQVLASRQDNA